MAQAKRKQRFFDVEIPIINKETQLYGFDLEDLNGRTISYDLTKFLRGKSVLLTLKVKIDSDANTKVFTEPIELVVLPSFTRRMIHKGTNYVEDSFSTQCKNAKVTLKPFLVTRKKVSRAVRQALREKAREFLIDYIKDKNTDEIFDEIIKNKIQKTLSLQLKKIYPLSFCDIRIFKIEKETK